MTHYCHSILYTCQLQTAKVPKHNHQLDSKSISCTHISLYSYKFKKKTSIHHTSVVAVIETGTETAFFLQNRNRGFMPLY